MDATSDRQRLCQPGDEVFGCDEHKLGKVKEVHPGYVLVEKGLIFSTDYYVPTTAINNCEGGRVYLNVTRDEALNRGWDAAPPTDTGVGETTGIAQ